MTKRKMQVCENHLPALYKALRSDDLSRLEALEHELTDEEKCVACSYLFKTHGMVRSAFEEYLRSEGFAVSVTEANASWKTLQKWLLRSVLFVIVLLCVSVIVQSAKNILTGMHVSLPSFTLVEMTLVGVVSCVLFLLTDDMFFG